VRCYEENVGEHIGNLRNILRTHWELNGNIHREPEKIEKTILPNPKLKRKKKQDTLMACLGLPIGCCMKFLFPKESVTTFGLGSKNTLPIINPKMGLGFRVWGLGFFDRIFYFGEPS
jgi:hypothetical protein